MTPRDALARTGPVVATVVAVVGLLAACGGQPDPSPPGPTTTRPAATTSEPADRVAPFAAAPCTLLTDAQRTTLGKKGLVVRAGRVRASAQKPTCEYGDFGNRPAGSLWVTTFVVTDAGLAELTADHANGFSPEYWKPGTMAGHPVIYYTAQGSPEFCDVALGVTDSSYVGVEVIEFGAQAPRENTCKSTTPIAEQVLTTITGTR